MTPPVAEPLSSVATAAGIVATVVGTIIGVLTYLFTRKGQKGSDIERLTGVLSTWSTATIGDLRQELADEERRRHTEVEAAELRCRTMVAQLRAEFDLALAEEKARADYWRKRALGEDVDDLTPPPEAR